MPGTLPGGIRQIEHRLFTFEYDDNTTVLMAKKKLVSQANVIGQRQILIENLEFCMCKHGEIYLQYGDSDCIS